VTFQTIIATARRELNLTQAELAAALGVDKQSVSNWECGRNAPWPAHRERLLSKLKEMNGHAAPSRRWRGSVNERILKP
jgi:transcriptional regulator with XRE-family HTH domain